MKPGAVMGRTTDRLEAVQRMEAEGRTVAQTAEALGVTTRTVSRLRMRARGYKAFKPAPVTPERLEMFSGLLDDGWSYVEISRTHNVSWRTLSRHFPGRGWDRAEVGRAGAAGKLMNAIPDVAMPAVRTSFAARLPVRHARHRPAYLAGAHVDQIRRVG